MDSRRHKKRGMKEYRRLERNAIDAFYGLPCVNLVKLQAMLLFSLSDLAERFVVGPTIFNSSRRAEDMPRSFFDSRKNRLAPVCSS
jgi:hypothetical protein